MWNAITQVAENVGFSFPTLIWLVVLMGTIIFFASGFKHGLIIGFIFNAGLFIWFYEAELNYMLPLISLFLNLIIMALSFIAISKSKDGGYI